METFASIPNYPYIFSNTQPSYLNTSLNTNPSRHEGPIPSIVVNEVSDETNYSVDAWHPTSPVTLLGSPHTRKDQYSPRAPGDTSWMDESTLGFSPGSSKRYSDVTSLTWESSPTRGHGSSVDSSGDDEPSRELLFSPMIQDCTYSSLDGACSFKDEEDAPVCVPLTSLMYGRADSYQIVNTHTSHGVTGNHNRWDATVRSDESESLYGSSLWTSPPPSLRRRPQSRNLHKAFSIDDNSDAHRRALRGRKAATWSPATFEAQLTVSLLQELERNPPRRAAAEQRAAKDERRCEGRFSVLVQVAKRRLSQGSVFQTMRKRMGTFTRWAS
ncbi:hypothetical protein K474DRAFT_250493 [Panus rudis PR-1116 ss-1]|nr:hypothetical protein K474DRAFT_250493 [Panus rudis PR-1116 ss-1]